MIRQGLVFFVIVAIGVQTSKHAVIGLWYNLNKDRITELFCINKEN
jgi:hypothetical protein